MTAREDPQYVPGHVHRGVLPVPGCSGAGTWDPDGFQVTLYLLGILKHHFLMTSGVLQKGKCTFSVVVTRITVIEEIIVYNT